MVRSKADQLTDLILIAFRLNGVLSDWGDKFASVDELSSARWQVLGAVALANQPPTAPQIAAQMGVTRQGAQKQLNLLVEGGLMESCPNPMHKRSPLYVLTQRGRDVFGSIDARWRSHTTQTASSFRSADLEIAEKVLTALIGAYSLTETEHKHEA